MAGIEDVLVGLPQEVLENILDIVLFLKAIGVLLVAYIAFLIFKGVCTLKMNKRISEMYDDIKKIKKKLRIKWFSNIFDKDLIKIFMNLNSWKKLLGDMSKIKFNSLNMFISN